MSGTMTEKIAHWFANGRVGISSRNMARVALGLPMTDGAFSPLDPDDLNRCIKLVKAVPEIQSVFPKIAKLSKRWAAVIEHWDKLVTMFHEEVGEDWSKARSAPKTYARMKELGL